MGLTLHQARQYVEALRRDDRRRYQTMAAIMRASFGADAATFEKLTRAL